MEVKLEDHPLNGKHVLIVEDDLSSAILLEEILSGKGLIINHVTDGGLAVEFAKEQPVDVIIMDLFLPVLSGYEATAIIKSFKPDVHIIAQTAFINRSDFQNYKEKGFDAYLTKPVSINTLLNTLYNLVR